MRIFVGYGYNQRDLWIEEYVFPLLEAFGVEVVSGKEVYGLALPTAIGALIKGADAAIGFTTRRDDLGGGRYGTHQWVIDELVVAQAPPNSIPWVEVREDGVEFPGGLLPATNLQRITYQESDRALCLVAIAQALRRFCELTNVTTIRLGPSAVIDQISPMLDDPSFSCECRTLRGIIERQGVPNKVRPIKGGLFVQLQGVAPDELVRVAISAGGHTWRSSYESIDTVDLQLR